VRRGEGKLSRHWEVGVRLTSCQRSTRQRPPLPPPPAAPASGHDFRPSPRDENEPPRAAPIRIGGGRELSCSSHVRSKIAPIVPGKNASSLHPKACMQSALCFPGLATGGAGSPSLNACDRDNKKGKRQRDCRRAKRCLQGDPSIIPVAPQAHLAADRLPSQLLAGLSSRWPCGSNRGPTAGAVGPAETDECLFAAAASRHGQGSSTPGTAPRPHSFLLAEPTAVEMERL
jgi:hypothetical protein